MSPDIHLPKRPSALSEPGVPAGDTVASTACCWQSDSGPTAAVPGPIRWDAAASTAGPSRTQARCGQLLPCNRAPVTAASTPTRRGRDRGAFGLQMQRRWAMLGSNQRPPPCRDGALPAELIAREELNVPGDRGPEPAARCDQTQPVDPFAVPAPFERPLAAPRFVLGPSCGRATRRPLRPRAASASDHSRCRTGHERAH